MCIIVDNWRNPEPVKEDILRHCWDANDDGAGIVWQEKDRLHVQKGLMEWDDFIQAYRKVCSHRHAVHFRIGTSGLDAKGCTHPFPISSTDKILNTLSYNTNGIVLMHNGVLGEGEGRLSDTQVFVKRFMFPLYKMIGDRMMSNKWFRDVIEYELGQTNRVLLVHPKHGTIRYGQGWVKDGETYFSNTSYKFVVRKLFSDFEKEIPWHKCEVCGIWFPESHWKEFVVPMMGELGLTQDEIQDEIRGYSKTFCTDCFLGINDTMNDMGDWRDKL